MKIIKSPMQANGIEAWIEYATPEKPPEGFFTARKISEQIGKKITATKVMLKKGVEDGKIEKKSYVTPGCATPIPHYRLIKNEKSKKSK